MQDLLDSLPPPVAEALVRYGTDPHVLLGALGLLLLVAGGRLYRLVVLSPGLAAGVAIGLEITAGQDWQLRMAATVALAVIGAALLHYTERLAIAAAGSFVAVGLARALSPMALGTEAPWYVLVAAGLVGLLLLPRLYRRLLPVLTPAMGALCVAWALERPTDVLLIGGLTLVGVVIQLASRSSG